MSLMAAQSLLVLGVLFLLLVIVVIFVVTIIYFYYKHCVNAKRTAHFEMETEDGLVIQIKDSNELAYFIFRPFLLF